MKKLIIFLLGSIGYVYCQPPHDVETLYQDVYKRWPSPPPIMHDRFVDFLCHLPHYAVVAEIGVQEGSFSRFIVEQTYPRKLYLIDCWEQQDPKVYDDSEANVENKLQEKYYQDVQKKFMHDDRVIIMKKYSHEAVDLFEDEFFDWVYIDANHSYEAAKEDIARWWPKVKRGGYMAGHDYVVRPAFGVLQAVNEFLRDNNLYFSLLTNEEGRHDSWAIQKPY